MGGRERGASKWNITGGAQDAAGCWALRLSPEQQEPGGHEISQEVSAEIQRDRRR